MMNILNLNNERIRAKLITVTCEEGGLCFGGLDICALDSTFRKPVLVSSIAAESVDAKSSN
jgi:hypothetical protein